ncbi:hypothetical protein LXL04_039698 [Taraxacum kok-saghyz]
MTFRNRNRNPTAKPKPHRKTETAPQNLGKTKIPPPSFLQKCEITLKTIQSRSSILTKSRLHPTADGVNRSSRTLSNRRLTPCLPPVVNRSSRTLSNRRRRQSLTSDPQSLTSSLLVSLLSSIAHREHSATADAVNRSPATLSPSPAHSLSPSCRPSRFTPPSSARLATADNTYADSQNTYPVSSLLVSLKVNANSEVRMIMHRKNTMELESEWNLSEKCTLKLVDEYKHMLCQATEPMSTFLEYITYGHMIDNVVLIVTGTLHERDVQELLEKCHPLGMFDSIATLAVAQNMRELYRLVLVDTPLAPYFSECITSEDLDDMNIEIMRNTLYKAYLEDFYRFCQKLGGATAEIMSDLLAFEADRRASAIIFVVASSTNKEDTKFKRFWIQSNPRKCSSGEDVQVVENGDVEMSKFKDGNHIFYYGSVTTEFATESLLRILQRKDSYGFYNGSVPTDFATEYIGYGIKSSWCELNVSWGVLGVKIWIVLALNGYPTRTIRIFQHSLSVTSDGSSAESASSSEEVVIYTNVVADSEWELSEGTCSEGKEILDLQPRFGLANRTLRQPRSRWFRNCDNW